jgi:hypothetical protein
VHAQGKNDQGLACHAQGKNDQGLAVMPRERMIKGWLSCPGKNDQAVAAMTTERMMMQRKRSTLVILSGVGAYATTQSKDLCIRFSQIKRPRATGAKRHAGAEGR